MYFTIVVRKSNTDHKHKHGHCERDEKNRNSRFTCQLSTGAFNCISWSFSWHSLLSCHHVTKFTYMVKWWQPSQLHPMRKTVKCTWKLWKNLVSRPFCGFFCQRTKVVSCIENVAVQEPSPMSWPLEHHSTHKQYVFKMCSERPECVGGAHLFLSPQLQWREPLNPPCWPCFTTSWRRRVWPDFIEEFPPTCWKSSLLSACPTSSTNTQG